MTDTDDRTTTTSERDTTDGPGEQRRTRVRRVTRSARPSADRGSAGTTHDDGDEADLTVIRRRRRGRAGASAPGGAGDETDATAAPDTAADRDGEGKGDEERAGKAKDDRSRRGRGERGRGQRGAAGSTKAKDGGTKAKDGGTKAKDGGTKAKDGGAKAKSEDAKAKDGGKADEAEAPSGSDDKRDSQPTRLQSRGRRGRGRGRGRGRKPGALVSTETRRTIAESPPRRMLVQVGDDRTQIAVLEERTLVEHFVTRKADVSYVGNIYLGRVQNVLPGMEAAFIDIGKGRNGVLYAGEVNYDEEDLDGELPRIEQTLKPGQTVLVQVTKDPMGTKGARLTQRLSVAGRYCVLAPGDGMLGISRKLPDDERERLRALLQDLRPEEYGLIVRTAAEGVTREQLEADVARLTRIWQQIEERSKTAKALEPVYEEPHLVMRVIRDVFGSEYSELIIDDAGLAEDIKTYLRDVAPEMAEKVKVYEGGEWIFDAYEVTTQVRRALEKKVWLRSGGYLIIEKTEAMWVVDVNTGKFVGEDNLEETVLRNNLEAAEEIARQLRLRDMGGIIVIDFVDMLVPANRDEVLKRFKRELARDKTKSRVMDISRLGLVQMTRKNVSQGVFENFTTRCETCEGRGARILDEAFK